MINKNILSARVKPIILCQLLYKVKSLPSKLVVHDISINSPQITGDSCRVVRLSLMFIYIILRDLTNRLDLNISKKTIIRRHREIDIRKRIARTKLHLTLQHMEARLLWAGEPQPWMIE